MSLWRAAGSAGNQKPCALAGACRLCCLPQLPWYAYIYLYVDQTTMAAMSTKETVAGFSAPAAMILIRFIIYFIVVLPGLLPWTFLLPWALYKRFRMLAPSRLRVFLEVWFVFVFAFFSLCAIKKPQYVVMLSCVFAAWLGTVVTDTLRAVFRQAGYGPYRVAICLSGCCHCGSVQGAFVAFKKPAGSDSRGHGSGSYPHSACSCRGLACGPRPCAQRACCASL